MSPAGERRAGRPGKLTAVGVILRMTAGMAFAVFGGYALDRLLGTFPWFVLAGTVLGAALVMYDLLRRSSP